MKKKILVIDDETDVRENISELLKLENYDVIEAKNGIEGLARIKTYRPDLVICDVLMPGMNGFEVLRKMQEEVADYDKPFIFLSAVAERKNIREGMSLGADDYLTKPFTRAEILEAVSTRLTKMAHIEDKYSKLGESIAASLPHELLSPLNTILTTSNLQRNESKTFTHEEVVEFGRLIHSSAEIINNVFAKYLLLLEIHMVRANERELKKYVKEICMTPDEIVKVVANEKAVSYSRTNDLRVRLDRSNINVSNNHLYHVAYELIDNAFKFSKPGNTVSVLGGVSFSDYLLSVSNTGSEITQEEIAKIGEFIKYDRGGKSIGGLGLGLSIAKSICENYNASFDITGTGSSVTVNCRFKIRK